jgi:hypothetical protein
VWHGFARAPEMHQQHREISPRLHGVRLNAQCFFEVRHGFAHPAGFDQNVSQAHVRTDVTRLEAQRRGE